MTYNGYAPRGNDIFGVAGTSNEDKLPYMTLSYANGMGYELHVKKDGGRVDVTQLDTSPIDFQFPATVPRDSETHGGEDVAIYANGPMSHLFSGTIEQHVIPHILAYASCIGNGLKACDQEI
jgi:alkaline phosphatase